MFVHTMNLGGTICRVIAGNGAIEQIGPEAKNAAPKADRVALCADENAHRFQGAKVEALLKEAGLKVYVAILPPGEEFKNMDMVLRLYHNFHLAGITRTDLIAALGGGVTGDMSGFAAATYLRGIRLMQIPTTLLAQVDSCVGGKTGIDMPFGKNLVGAFYQPSAVVADPEVLSSLPARHMAEGMAEVIKYGCILDKDLFVMVENGEVPVNEIVPRCLKIKCSIVEKDERDTGERMLLNFGHTLGHAAEKCMNFTGITHGEAVAAGMVLAAKIGEALGETKPGTSRRIASAVRSHGLPDRFDIPLEGLLSAAGVDKKILGGKLNFILIKDIGEPVIKPLLMEELQSVLEKVYY
ncbi:MAG: 3-dehydroquinate synthase [Bacillota bacterium]|nr:3-dehydroquinate synthase [Bacillota bacterium]